MGVAEAVVEGEGECLTKVEVDVLLPLTGRLSGVEKRDAQP
jgi:hypothetical protein